MKSTDALIQKLSQQKLVVVSPPATRIHLIYYLAFVALYVLLFGALTDLSRIDWIPLTIKLALGFIAAALTAQVALSSSIPGKLTFGKTILALSTTLSWLLISIIVDTNPLTNPMTHCVECMLVVTVLLLLPSSLLLYFVWKGAILQSEVSAFYSVLSGGIIANLVMTFRCEVDSTLHIFLFHILPSSIVISAVAWIFHHFFNWNSLIRRFKSKIME